MEDRDGVGLCISELGDAELLSNTRALIGRSNQVFAALLAHLGEVEARGLHRTRACSSLYAYCIYGLRLSEDAAVRRVTAARLVRQFPALLDAIATGELHLTGLLMLGPHLTRDNHLDVLARAKHRTKKELAKLVRLLDPLPEVPARIEALGPAPAGRATWADYVTSFNPVRELTPGDRPREWADAAPTERSAPARIDAPTEPFAPASPARIDAPLRYKVQFTATEEYVELIERAQALLSHLHRHREHPATCDEIQLEALRGFVAQLEKKRAGAHPQKGARDPENIASKPEAATPRSRHIPARIRRAVFERDSRRCTYVDDASARRCEETHRLELHHLKPFANGGQHTEQNLTLRCQAHNALAAELDLGRDRILEKRDAARHLSRRNAGNPGSAAR
jgi:5-methylcytosine-specific restriction endonuclease McrA